MVQYHIGSHDRDRIAVKSVFGPRAFLGVARPDANVPHDHVGRVDADTVVRNGDPFAWRGLARDGDVSVGKVQVRREADRAADVEYDRPRPIERGGESVAQRACAQIVEIGYVIHVSTAPAGSKASFPFGSGKCRQLGVCGVNQGTPCDEQNEAPWIDESPRGRFGVIVVHDGEPRGASQAKSRAYRSLFDDFQSLPSNAILRPRTDRTKFNWLFK